MENKCENESYWILSSKSKGYPSLKENINCNIVVVGAGITGITTAYLLAKEGIDVILVEADKIAYSSSGRNTGKVTTQHDNFYSKIYRKYGLDTARLYYKSNEEALDLVEQIINENNIKCHFERLPSYVFTESKNYVKTIEEEYKICKEIGIDCEYHSSLDIPLEIKAAISFKNQAQFNPKQYLDSLAELSEKMGVKIYENTPIEDLQRGELCTLKTRDGNIIKCKEVVIASHLPWYDGLNLYFAKEYQDRSYLVAGDIDYEFPKGMYINLEKPSLTFRSYEGENQKLLILGGRDHKVGQGSNEDEIYSDLKEFAYKKFGAKNLKYQWSAQDCMSFDNLPYIGYISLIEKNIYAATGYSKWGMTNGTMAAILIRNMIIGRSTIYDKIFNPSRIGPYLSKDFIVENLNVASNYILGKLNHGKNDVNIDINQSEILNIDGQRYGAYRDDTGKLYIVDITCTHLGCELKFNKAERSWDCPCHGSRFDYKGNILEGPALKPLRRYGMDDNDVNPKLL